jgi:hypothetical protein
VEYYNKIKENNLKINIIKWSKEGKF